MSDDFRAEIQDRDRVGHVQVRYSVPDYVRADNRELEADRLGYAEWRNNLQVQQREIIRDADHIRHPQTWSGQSEHDRSIVRKVHRISHEQRRADLNGYADSSRE